METVLEFELTRSQKISLGITEIAKRIREQIKKEFPIYKFSVTKQTFACYIGGSAIIIALMQAPFSPFVDSLPGDVHRREKLEASLAQAKEKGHVSVNHYKIQESVWLSTKAIEVFSRVRDIANQYNFDESDHHTDHFCVNFMLDMQIGKWDKPFKLI